MEGSAVAPSSSKRAKRNPGVESNEMSKLQLDSEKSLHDVQCFVEELFTTRKTCPRGPALNSFVDPVVNLNIDLLLNKIRSSSSEVEHAAKLQLPGSLETLLQKLGSENESLRRNEVKLAVMESELEKKEAIINKMKKEASTSRVWMADLQEQNDRLSSQLFMYQMQLVQQISLNQQQNIITSAALSGDFDNEAIKNEINNSSS